MPRGSTRQAWRRGVGWGGGWGAFSDAGGRAGQPHKAASAAEAWDHLARAGGGAACLHSVGLPFTNTPHTVRGWLVATWVRGVGERGPSPSQGRKRPPGWGPLETDISIFQALLCEPAATIPSLPPYRVLFTLERDSSFLANFVYLATQISAS